MKRFFTIALLFITSSCVSIGASERIDLVAGALPRIYGYAGDGGNPLSANFTWTTDATTDAAGNIVIVDIYSPGTPNAGRLRVINTQSTTQTLWGVSVCAGCIQTIAGNGSLGYTGDNGPATSAELNHPSIAVVDSSGNIFFADQANNVIRKIDTGGTITTYAGGGGGHCSPCLRTSVTYVLPQSVAIGPDGNLYIGDTNYNLIEVINTHATTQTIFGVSVPSNNSATVVGNFGVTGVGVRGDGGPATSASLDIPLGLSLDSLGNLYIADTQNNLIRKVDHTTNNISTVAGSISKTSVTNVVATGTTITYTYTLTSGPALTVGTYMDVKGCTSAGNNSSVAGPNFDSLRITGLGAGTFTVSSTHGVSEAESGCTAWGGSQGWSGDGSAATSAQLYFPYDVKIDTAGDMYISDTLNNVIRKVDHNTGNISNFAGVQYTYIAEEGTPSIAGGQYGGDGGNALAAHLNFVVGFWPVPGTTTMYLGDGGNSLVRKLSLAACSGFDSCALGGVATSGGITVK
jgi:trimeric autotransporter adhesin